MRINKIFNLISEKLRLLNQQYVGFTHILDTMVVENDAKIAEEKGN